MRTDTLQKIILCVVIALQSLLIMHIFKINSHQVHYMAVYEIERDIARDSVKACELAGKFMYKQMSDQLEQVLTSHVMRKQIHDMEFEKLLEIAACAMGRVECDFRQALREIVEKYFGM